MSKTIACKANRKNFEWRDSTEFSYTNWAPNKPSDFTNNVSKKNILIIRIIQNSTKMTNKVV